MAGYFDSDESADFIPDTTIRIFTVLSEGGCATGDPDPAPLYRRYPVCVAANTDPFTPGHLSGRRVLAAGPDGQDAWPVVCNEKH